MKYVLALSLMVVLAACSQNQGIGFGRYAVPEKQTGPVPLTAEQRQAAEQTIAQVIAQEFPSAPTAPAANCGIDFASQEEASFLASAETVDTIVTQNVLTILARPSTQECLSENGVQLL